MNLHRIIVTVIAFAFIVGCGAKENGREEQVETNTIEISGKVQGGYRILSLAPVGEPLDLTVYRGDYIKLFLDDQGAERSDYAFEVPDLDISATVTDTLDEQPYFKMKTSGSFPFTIGERTGVMNVIELEQANYSELTNNETWELLNQEDPPLLLDVRTLGEYYRGNLEGSMIIPLQELQMRVDELEKHKNHPIIIYCATGNRSTTAAKILLDRGFKDIMNVRQGIVGWARDGYPISR